MVQTMNLSRMENAENINFSLDKLPVAELKEIQTKEGTDLPLYRAVMVGDKAIDIPTKYYALVQHKEAFRPIVEGLTMAGQHDWKYQLKYNNNKAKLNIYTTSINDGVSEIFLGFAVTNSFDRTTRVNYGMSISQGKQFVEIVGYRKVCSNGMIMRVPLEQAEFMRAEQKQQITELMKKGFAFLHRSGVEQKIENIQYIVEAMALIRTPLLALIEKAKSITLEDMEKVETLLQKHFSERVADKILNRFSGDQQQEGNNIWSLFNAITYEASHGEISYGKNERMLESAGMVLNEAISTF